jgi:cytochrome c-type biogenesis protein CcmH
MMNKRFSIVIKYFVSLSRRLYESGFRTRRRDTFFCFASYMGVANAENAGAIFCQKKYPKKRRPYAASFLRSSNLSGFSGRDIPNPPENCGIPAATLRAIPVKFSGTRRGIREGVLLFSIRSLIAFWLCLLTPPIYAVDVYQLPNTEQQQAYETLTQELRCLVCQNQNIADSNAELAGDLRRQVFEMLQQGKSKDEIVTFMTDRYGDFVMYNPPLKTKTALLWLGPVAFLLMGLVTVAWVIRKRKQITSAPAISPEQQAKIKSLLNDEESP